jgi:hypothetical protein
VLKYDKTPESLPEPAAATATPEPQNVQKEPAQSEVPSNPIAIYPGRFQPYHAGHQIAYDALVKQFGKENVFIVTSDKQDSVKSPFSFQDKKNIMTSMFDIPEDNIIQVKSPYVPTELLSKFPENTPAIFAVGEKDSARLAGKYFQPFNPDEKMSGYKHAGYVWIAPPPNIEVNGKEISGSQLRAVMGNPNITDRAKQEIFTKVYGKFDKKVFDRVVKATTDSEEAAKLTQTHGTPTKKQSDTVAQSEKQPTIKGLDRVPPEKRDAVMSALKSKIRNEKTGRDILVATALKYDKQEPVYVGARALIDKALN